MCATYCRSETVLYIVLSQRKKWLQASKWLSYLFLSGFHLFSFILTEHKTVLLLKTTSVIHFFTASQICPSKTITGNIPSVCLMLGQHTNVTCCNMSKCVEQIYGNFGILSGEINQRKVVMFADSEVLSLRIFILGYVGRYVLGTTHVTVCFYK